MKKAICFLLVLSLAFGMSACAGNGKGGFVKTDAGLTLTRNGLTVTVDPDTGLVIGLASSTDSLENPWKTSLVSVFSTEAARGSASRWTAFLWMPELTKPPFSANWAIRT